MLATGFKRCRNILKGEILGLDELSACRDRWLAGGLGALGEKLEDLPEAGERALRQQVAAVVPALVAAEANGDYRQVFAHFAALGPAIDFFFEEVRVNAEEADLRILRHAFVREIHGLFAQYADFAAIAPVEG
jgi:glycyl-tRNA synthetase beta subunit